MSFTTFITTAGPRAAGPAQPASLHAQRAIAAATSAGVIDVRRIAPAIGELARKNPGEAADLLEEVGSHLGDAERNALRDEVASTLPSHVRRGAARDGQSPGPGAVTTALDLCQMALSIAGMFDPTPACDGLDGLISLMRGDKVGAAISFVSMIPYLGDAAKLGKLGKFADTLGGLAQLARVDPGAVRRLGPEVQRVERAFDTVVPHTLSKPAREVYERIRKALDTLVPLTRPQPRLVTFDLQRLEEVLRHVGDEVELIDDQLDAIQAGVRRAAAAGANELPEATCRRIERLIEQLKPQTFAEVTGRRRERSVLHDLFVEAERNVSHRATLREFNAGSEDVGRRLAELTSLEDAYESARSRRTQDRIGNRIGDVVDEIDMGRQFLLGDHTPRPAYELIRDEMQHLAETRGIGWPDGVVIHHLLPINLYPELATHPANLLLLHGGRGGSHELMHLLLGTGDRNLWAGFNAQVAAILERAIFGGD